MRPVSTLDRIRDRAYRLIDRSASLGKLNEALGRPLAPADELADRRAFATGYTAAPDAPPEPAPAPAPATAAKEAAPVFVYTLDKQRRDAERLAQMLDDAGVAYEVRSLENDPAAQAAVRRDSKGFRLPVVFIAGTAVGGRQELTNLGRAGIQKLVNG
jgi:glutaredoxin